MRMEHKAGDKLFVDYTGSKLWIYPPGEQPREVGGVRSDPWVQSTHLCGSCGEPAQGGFYHRLRECILLLWRRSPRYRS